MIHQFGSNFKSSSGKIKQVTRVFLRNKMINAALNESLILLRSVASAPHSVHELEEKIQLVSSYGVPEIIGPLLVLLDDNAEYDEEMFSLIHAAEAFPLSVYVEEFLKVMPVLRNSSPRWASIVLMRVLNSEEARNLLVRQLRLSSEDVKKSIEWLGEKINEQSPTFLEKTLPILLASRSQ